MARRCADLKPDSMFLNSEETKDGCLHLDHPLPGLQQTGLFSSGGCLGPSVTSSISFIFYCRLLVGLLRAPIYSISPPALWPGTRQGQPRPSLGRLFQSLPDLRAQEAKHFSWPSCSLLSIFKSNSLVRGPIDLSLLGGTRMATREQLLY